MAAKRRLEKLLEELKELEDLAKGGFVMLTIKIKYHQRGVSFLLYSLEAILLSQEIGQLDEANVLNKDSTFKNDQNWWTKVRPNNFIKQGGHNSKSHRKNSMVRINDVYLIVQA